MANCTDTVATENMDFCPDQENPAGVSPVEIFAARVSDFDTIIAPPALGVATTLEEAGTIAGPHTFTAPKGFFRITVLPETGLVDTQNQGEKGSKSNVNNFAATLPGTGAKISGFIRKYQNVGMIFLVTQVNGDIKQIGSKISPAYLSDASGSSGTKPGEVHGTPVKFSDVQAYPAPVYIGTITEFTEA